MIRATGSEKFSPLRAACSVFAFGLLAFTRLVYAPPYLFNFDSVNFALSIRRFDPGLHQPQPPGYPLFVALLKALDFFFHDANRSLTAAGLLGSALALLLIWLWTRRMFGEPAAWIAAALLFAHPIFWFAGIINPVRTFLVVAVASTALPCWRAITGEKPERWFYVASLALGFISGFRPECLVLLLPLWIAVAVYRRFPARTWAVASGILAVSALVWLAPLVARIGGIEAGRRLLLDYLRFNSQGETLPFGANVSGAAATFTLAAVWTMGMAITWIWALPFALRRLAGSWTRAHSVLLIGAFAPAFLFHALVHVREASQTLITIPVLCVIGGAALSALRPRPLMIAGACAAVLASAWNFRTPLYKDYIGGASRGAIRYKNDWNRSTFNALKQIDLGPDTVIVWDDSVVSWRHISYYYPSARLLYVHEEGRTPYWVLPAGSRPAQLDADRVLVPGVRTLVIGVSAEQGRAMGGLPGAQRVGPLVIAPFAVGSEMRVGGYTLRSVQ